MLNFLKILVSLMIVVACQASPRTTQDKVFVKDLSHQKSEEAGSSFEDQQFPHLSENSKVNPSVSEEEAVVDVTFFIDENTRQKSMVVIDGHVLILNAHGNYEDVTLSNHSSEKQLYYTQEQIDQIEEKEENSIFTSYISPVINFAFQALPYALLFVSFYASSQQTSSLDAQMELDSLQLRLDALNK